MEPTQVLKLLAFRPNITEPPPEAPIEPSAPYVSFAEPPVSPGGQVHLKLDPNADPKPTGLTVVYLPAGRQTEDSIDLVAAVAPESGYPLGAIALTDPSLTAVTVQTETRPAPGQYDVAVIGVFADVEAA